MSSKKSNGFFVIGLFTLALSIALPAAACETSHSAAEGNAACKQARQDLMFLQQLAMTDGGTNPYINAPTPAACQPTADAAKKTAASESQAAEKTASNSADAARRYN